MKRMIFLLIFSIFVFSSVCTENKANSKMIGLYGFNRDAEIFGELSAEEIADYIVNAGINGVWAKFNEESIPAALRKKGIRFGMIYRIQDPSYQTESCFRRKGGMPESVLQMTR